MSSAELVHGVQLLFGGGKGGFEPGDLTEPALALGLGDTGPQVVTNLDPASALVGIGPQEWASYAAVFVRARGSEVAGAYAEGDLGVLLFISARTVEWHLREVFFKLGISSRRQLRHALLDRSRPVATG